MGLVNYFVFGEEVENMEIKSINGVKHSLKITFKEGAPYKDLTLYSSKRDVENIKRRFTDYPTTCYRIELERGNMLLQTGESFKRSKPFEK